MALFSFKTKKATRSLFPFREHGPSWPFYLCSNCLLRHHPGEAFQLLDLAFKRNKKTTRPRIFLIRSAFVACWFSF